MPAGATRGHAHSGFFALRAPLLPFDELEEWSGGLEAPAAAVAGDPGALERAVTRDRRRLLDGLLRRFVRADLGEALFLASPDLHDALRSSAREPEAEPPPKVACALAAYLGRAAARPTPFGLFAGCSVGSLTATTQLSLPCPDDLRRHSRLDMDYLSALADSVEEDPLLRSALTYRPNSSIHPASGGLRYVESRVRGGVRSHHLVAVAPTPHLLRTLERARDGACLDELARGLVDGTIAEPEAHAFVGELVDGQLLRSDLHPSVTGPEPVVEMVTTLARHPATRPIAARLDAARRALEELDASAPGAPVETYAGIAAGLGDRPARPDRSRLVQVDMIRPAPAATLGEAVVREMLRAVDVLHRVAPDRPADPLAAFRGAFLERYGEREVPLAEVLDEESGIGFEPSAGPGADSSPLLRDVPFPHAPEPPERWTARESLLLRRLAGALASGAQEVRLDEGDVSGLAGATTAHGRPLPDAFHVVAAVGARSQAALDAGDFRIVVQCAFGPSGANLLGRFCHADPQLHEHVVRHLESEAAAAQDRILAEIVHLPEGRTGNVLCRPVLRDHEIAYLGRSGAPPERQILVTDLTVSVEDGRVVLRSSRLRREIVPRLTTAHIAGGRCLGVYRLLAMLQYQGVASSLSWEWGPLSAAPFLPRVVSGRAVLSRACWRLSEDELRALARPEPWQRYAAVQEIRGARRLPRHVCLADGDNELLADLDNAVSVDTLAGQVKRRTVAVLVEMLPGPDELCLSGPGGRFVHEVVVPFARRGGAANEASRPGTATTAAAPPHDPVPRRFPPGSEWLYAKLYTGTATADDVLRVVVVPLVEETMAAGSVDRWHFVRYGDPAWHLRLRLHGPPARLAGEVLPRLRAAVAPLLDGGGVWRVALDTYDREVARYGGDEGIVLAEQIFHADSEAALGIVRTFRGDGGLDARWRLTLMGIDMLLSDLGLDLQERRRWARGLRDSFAAEFGADARLRRHLGGRHRADRDALEALLDTAPAATGPLQTGVALLRRRSEVSGPAVSRLRALDRAGGLSTPLHDIAASYAHMHANRMLRSAHRAQELVLYDLLDRLYLSRGARASAGRHE